MSRKFFEVWKYAEDGTPNYRGNRLANYATYSYHHILVACDSTDTAKELLQDVQKYAVDMFDVDDRLGDDVFSCTESSADVLKSIYSRTTPKGGKFCPISNGLNSCRYTVSKVSWKSSLMETGSDRTVTTVAEEGELEILEPLGVSFYNTIASIGKALGAEQAGMIFLLKTVFVGIPDTNDQIPEFIYDVRPMLFVGFDIHTTFGTQGSTHVFKFVSVKDGAAHSPQITAIGNTAKFNVNVGDTLYNTLKLFVQKLNDMYAAYVEKMRISGKDCGFDPDACKKIKYVLEVAADDPQTGPGYDNPKYIIDNLTAWQKDSKGGYNMDFGANVNVEDCIYRIMKSSSQAMTEKIGDDMITFKITNNYEVTKDEIVVTYKVLKYRWPAAYVDNYGKIVVVSDSERIKNMQDSSIEFDYIFTGKNIDIEENGFEMKMDLGVAFYRSVMVSNAVPQNQDECTGLGYGTTPGTSSSGGETKVNPNLRTDDIKPIIYPPTYNKDTQCANTSSLRLITNNFRSILSNYAAMQNVTARVTITGDPDLIMGPYPDESINAVDRLNNIPHFCKVNVKFPDSRYPDGEYAITDFWYQGYYMIISIENIFEGGKFTQILNLITQPVQGVITQDGKKTKCYSGEPPEPLDKPVKDKKEEPTSPPSGNVPDGTAAIPDEKLTEIRKTQGGVVRRADGTYIDVTNNKVYASDGSIVGTRSLSDLRGASTQDIASLNSRVRGSVDSGVKVSYKDLSDTEKATLNGGQEVVREVDIRGGKQKQKVLVVD